MKSVLWSLIHECLISPESGEYVNAETVEGGANGNSGEVSMYAVILTTGLYISPQEAWVMCQSFEKDV